MVIRMLGMGTTMDYILDNLAIGNYHDSLNLPPEITGVLCVAHERDVQNKSLLWHKVPIIDLTPIPIEQLGDAVTWIRSAHAQGHKVLVFCNEGIGRSPSVVITYLCWRFGFGFGEAVEYVARRRPSISILPNLISSIDSLVGQRLP